MTEEFIIQMKESVIQMKGILEKIKDLKQSLQAAGIDDTNELIKALRRLTVREFAEKQLLECLTMEE